MFQLMLLPLTVSCFSKIQIGFAFLVPAHPGSPGEMAVKRVCVCVSLCGCGSTHLEYTLPTDVVVASSLSTFRRLLKTFLIQAVTSSRGVYAI